MLFVLLLGVWLGWRVNKALAARERSQPYENSACLAFITTMNSKNGPVSVPRGNAI